MAKKAFWREPKSWSKYTTVCVQSNIFEGLQVFHPLTFLSAFVAHAFNTWLFCLFTSINRQSYFTYIDHTQIEGKSFDRFNMTEWIWPKNLNMTEKITPTNINLLNMTEIVWQRLSWAVEYDRNQKIKFVVLMNLPFMLVVLMNLFNFYYYFGHIQPVKFIVLMNLRHFKISVIFMGISVMFNRSCWLV